jgi:DNA-directed RNA polymerase sigma subunit (sigma70/sigma32)
MSEDLPLEALDEGVVLSVEISGLHLLTHKERYVFTRTIGLYRESQSLTSIGTDLGLSREAIRAIKIKADAKLTKSIVLRRVMRTLPATITETLTPPE